MIKIENIFNFEKIFAHKLYDRIGKTLKKNGEPRKIEGFYTRYPFLKNEDVKKWINAKLNKYTRTGKEPENFKIVSYLGALKKYLKFNKTNNPSELLKENIDDRNKRLLHFLGESIRNGTNRVTVHNNYQALIKSFYSARGSPMSDGLPTLSSGANKNEIRLNKESLLLIQNKLERPEYKIILKCMILLGLRISDVLNELTSELNEEPKYKLEKHGEHYYIDKFLTRKENIIINYMFFPKELEKLLKSTYNINDLTNLDLRTILKTRNGSNIKRNTFLDRVKTITNELGIKKNIKNHSFRKYFNTQICSINLLQYNAKIGSDFEHTFKEHLMGHKSKSLSDAYNQDLSNIDKFYELWIPIERAICIDYEIIDNTAEEIKDIKAELYEKDKEINNMKQVLNYFMNELNNLKKSVIYTDSINSELHSKLFKTPINNYGTDPDFKINDKSNWREDIEKNPIIDDNNIDDPLQHLIDTIKQEKLNKKKQ